MILTDTHTHLYSKDYDTDRIPMIQRALDANVTRLFLPNINQESAHALDPLLRKYPHNCFAMMGLHPCVIDANYQNDLQWLKTTLLNPTFKVIAIGEIGLDFYHDVTFKHEQEIAFRQQIELALHYKLPINLHVRSAFEETLKILNEYKSPQLRGIFHCFSGNIPEAKRALALGNFKLGIGGVVTFKNSKLAEVVNSVDLKDLVLETDAPYLAPVPFRGQRNESAYLTLIAQKIADIKQTSLEQVAQITTQNSIDIFGI